MSPLEIEILLWYYSRARDYRDGDFSAPAVRETIDRFRDTEKLIEPVEVSAGATYRLTDRGQAFVDHIMSASLPVCRWEIPQRTGAVSTK